MKKVLLLSLLFFCCVKVNAQSPLAKTAVYLELAGNGGLYSLNVEHSISQRFNARIGFASWSTEQMFGGEEKFFTIPVMLNTFFGPGNHKLEVGAGFMFGSEKYESDPQGFSGREDSKESIFNLTGVAGYRYQKPTGGFLFRAGVTPFLNLSGAEDPYPDSGLMISGGVSVGYVFKLLAP